MSKRKKSNSKKLSSRIVFGIIILLCLIFIDHFNIDISIVSEALGGGAKNSFALSSFDLSSIPEFDETPYVILNDNKPEFTQDELNAKEGFEEYGDLDNLGRCTYAIALVGLETMPQEKRESISAVKPSGWQISKYDFIDGKYLYNRCHLIGYQLTAENANKCNLITGTRYLNVTGMLPFENQIADYVDETENHVLYRVTPIFENDNLVASGVQMEAYSIEDSGKGVCFNIYAYNVQPNVKINYKDGSNKNI